METESEHQAAETTCKPPETPGKGCLGCAGIAHTITSQPWSRLCRIPCKRLFSSGARSVEDKDGGDHAPAPNCAAGYFGHRGLEELCLRGKARLSDSMGKMLFVCFGLVLEVPAGDNNSKSKSLSSQGRSSCPRKQREMPDFGCAVDTFGQVSRYREQGTDFHLSHPAAPASPLEMSGSGYSRWGSPSPDLY